LIKKSEIILWRRRYLKDIKRYRKEGRPIYYVASSEGFSTGAINLTGGKRLIVNHISSEDRFVLGGLLCFESKKNTKNYHNEMNRDSIG